MMVQFLRAVVVVVLASFALLLSLARAVQGSRWVLVQNNHPLWGSHL